MKLTITQYKSIAKSPNGDETPVGAGYNGTQTLTGVGAATAVASGTTLVRIATDTAVTVDAASPGVSAEFLPANGVEFFQVVAGQVLTFS